MGQPAYSPPLPAPALVRLLAGWGDGGVRSASPDLSEQLSLWLDWNRAVTLSRALDGRLPAAPEPADACATDDQAEVAQARAELTALILGPPPERKGVAAAADAFAPYRQRCLAVQRNAQAATGRLRGQLRDRLCLHSPALARLAEVDAAMEQTLSPREQALLATVPTLLHQHFERLRTAATASASPDAAWQPRFLQDMQGMLLAELDLRFQPIDGLLAALAPR